MRQDAFLEGARTGTRTAPSASRLDQWLLGRLGAALAGAPVRLVLWDGTAVGASSSSHVGTALIKDRRTLVSLLRDPELEFGEAYSDGRVEVRGDLVGFLESVIRATAREGRRLPAFRLPRRRSHSLHASRENARHHYDVGNDFYRLWLDEEMVYTCAYYPSETATLEEAQRAKMEYVCRKLRLRPGESVVEAGCGWGALALHMARRHGVTVRAYNVSGEQVRWAKERAKAEGLEERVTFVKDDYRAIEGTYDVFVSVGMLEHVGRENYPALGDVITRCLKPSGRGLLHFIGRDRHEPLNAWMRRRIFPGAYPATVAEVLQSVLEPRRLSVLDVENLRLHYAKTTAEWLRRYEAVSEQVAATFGERFTRAWRLYLAGCVAAFNAGSLQLFQILFARSGENDVAMTRAALYGDGL